MDENWKTVPGTRYLISDLGNVYSEISEAPVKLFSDSRGYLQFYIYKDNSRYLGRPHRLVALNFLEFVPGKLIVNHKDCVKSNNIVGNLEWSTIRENTQHAADNGLIASGEDCHLHILKELEVLEILDLLDEGFRDIEISRCFGVSPNTIADIRSGRTWKQFKRDVIAKMGPIKKLSGEDIPFIRNRINAGERDCDIALTYDVATATINQIRHGRTWKNY